MLSDTFRPTRKLTRFQETEADTFLLRNTSLKNFQLNLLLYDIRPNQNMESHSVMDTLFWYDQNRLYIGFFLNTHEKMTQQERARIAIEIERERRGLLKILLIVEEHS